MVSGAKIFGSIGRKILLWFMFISIIPAIIIVSIGYHNSRKLIVQQLTALLDNTVYIMSREICGFVSAKKVRLVDFASDGLIRDGLMVINASSSGNESIVERLNYHLSVNKLPLDTDFKTVSVVDLDGKCVASSNEAWVGRDISDKDYFVQGLRQGIYISDLYYCDENSETMITMSKILTNIRTGATLGLLVINLRGKALSDITKSWDDAREENTPGLHGLGRTGEVYIVNKDNLMITESRFVENAILKQIVDTEPVQKAFYGSEMAGIYTDYRGFKVLGASRLIDELGWIVLAEKNLSEVVEPINTLRNIGIGLISVGAVAVVIIAFFVTRSLIRPIHKLVAATERVAKGDLDCQVRTTSGDEIGLLSNSFNDMTQNLQKSRGELRALFDDGVDPMFVLGTGETIADVNESACSLLGRDRNSLLGTDISKLIGHREMTPRSNYTLTEARHMVAEAIRKTWSLNPGAKYPTFDVSLTTKDGEEAICELDFKRTEYGVFAVFRDVTVKKQLEQDIIDEKKRLDDIVTQIGAGISLVDRNMKVVWMNEQQSRWFGYPNEIRGRACYEAYWRNSEICQGCPVKKTFVTSGIEKALQLHTTPDGKQRWYNITSSPLKDRKGRVTHVLELVEDITEEKQAEEEFRRLHESVIEANTKLKQTIIDLQLTQQQLIQAEKMASVGQLAASIAHEINNPLSYIDNNFDILTKYSERLGKFLNKCEVGRHIIDNGDLARTNAFLQEIQDLKEEIKLDYILKDFEDVIKESTSGVERIKSIVSNLNIFSHVGRDRPIYANLNNVIEGILVVVWGEVKYKAEIVKEYGDIPDIKCHPQQLGQVFMNLLVNAAHAIEGKGEIRIKTYKAADNVCVDIKDNGKGIPEEIQKKIFKPFFTTKEPGKGTGLGLKVVNDIIKKHSGKISVLSKVGVGTTFTVVLPISE